MVHDPALLALLCMAFAAAAALYSSVGHGGASAYLAIMALASMPPATMKPTGLALNLLVAGFGAWRYIRAGRFDARLFWPIALGAMPFAFLGGAIQLPGRWYQLLLGLVLLFVAIRLLWPERPDAQSEVHPPSVPVAVASGAGLGLLAGLTGTGGGIFLSPLMVFKHWTRIENITGIAALFILFNSIAGLAGNYAALRALPPQLPWLMASVAIGALIGTWLGVSRYSGRGLRTALGMVTLVACIKLIAG